MWFHFPVTCEFWRTLWPLRWILPSAHTVEISLAVVCKLSYQLKLNYLGHRSPFPLLLQSQFFRVGVSQVSVVALLTPQPDSWLTRALCPFTLQTKHRPQSQWRDCSGSNKSKGWECGSPRGPPEGADEGGVPGKGPSAEGTKRGVVRPETLGFRPRQWLACRGSVWKRPCLFAQTLLSSSFVNWFRGRQGKPWNSQTYGGPCPQAGCREEAALTQVPGPNTA